MHMTKFGKGPFASRKTSISLIKKDENGTVYVLLNVDHLLYSLHLYSPSRAYCFNRLFLLYMVLPMTALCKSNASGELSQVFASGNLLGTFRCIFYLKSYSFIIRFKSLLL